MKAEKPNLIDELMSDIIEPGIQRLMQTRYFTELRSGLGPGALSLQYHHRQGTSDLHVQVRARSGAL